MKQIAEIREKIYDHFQSSSACQEFFFGDAQEEKFAAYYTSMYLLQDATDSLMVHRQKDFSNNPFEAYIEFWGVMQAIIIQQDSICELYWAIKNAKLDWSNLTSWKRLRNLRNICAGHPAKKDRPKQSPLTRTFMGRSFGNYSSFHYEQWDKPKFLSQPKSIMDHITCPEIELGKLIDDYAREAKDELMAILQFLKKQWPAT
jgi:hypothetical protein